MLDYDPRPVFSLPFDINCYAESSVLQIYLFENPGDENVTQIISFCSFSSVPSLTEAECGVPSYRNGIRSHLLSLPESTPLFAFRRLQEAIALFPLVLFHQFTSPFLS